MLCLATNCEYSKESIASTANKTTTKYELYDGGSRSQIARRPTMISLGRQDSPTEDGLVLATGSLDLADFVSATSDGNRELQDLSLNDAEELQAFVAKRKWFEIKLQVSLSYLQLDIGCS